MTNDQNAALDRLAKYIQDNIGAQDWQKHIYDCSGYVAATLNMKEREVVRYLMLKLKIG